MRWGRVVVIAAAAVLLAGCGSSKHAATSTQAPANQLRGLVPEPFPVKPSFTLTDTSGRAYSLDQATRGKLTYLFFGYTHCPDACPATMSYIKYALTTQSPAIQRKVAVVFVTVDPTRDKPKVLRAWLNHYDKSFVGLTGSLQQIGDVEHMAGVPTAILKKHKGVASYEVEHSSILFVYSPDDRSHVVYASGFKPQDYAHDLPLLLKFR
jgi:protein SCO1/2